MSEEKRVPYSVYLTPKAASTLESYVKGSGYLSTSRTVEEIILAFDAIFKSIQTFGKLTSSPIDQIDESKQAQILYALFSFFSSIQNITLRLGLSEEGVTKWAMTMKH